MPTSTHNVITASQHTVRTAVLAQPGPIRLSPVLITFAFDGSRHKHAMTLFSGFVSNGMGAASAHGLLVPPRWVSSWGVKVKDIVWNRSRDLCSTPSLSGNLLCFWLFPYLAFIAKKLS